MTTIKTKDRLLKAKANVEKSIGSLDFKEVERESVIVTYSREALALDSIASVAPLARNKPDSISSSIDFMLYVRGKPKDENIIIELARPQKIVTAPSESVETLVVKGVSMPLKSYSSSTITRFASSLLGGFDALMSQSLSAFFGLIVNISIAYYSYRKKGSSKAYFFSLLMLLIGEALVTIGVSALCGFIFGFKSVKYAAIIMALFILLINYIFKLFRKRNDRKTGLVIDEMFESTLFEKVKSEQLGSL